MLRHSPTLARKDVGWNTALRLIAMMRPSLPPVSEERTAHYHKSFRGLVTANRACGLACGSLAKGMTKISYQRVSVPSRNLSPLHTCNLGNAGCARSKPAVADDRPGHTGAEKPVAQHGI